MLPQKYDLILTGNTEPNILNKASIAMPLSLPLPGITKSFLGDTKEEQKIRITSILEDVIKSGCNSFTIEFADYLQRFAVMNACNMTENEAIKKINALSIPFFEMLSIILAEFKQRIKQAQQFLDINVVKWQDNLLHHNYKSCSAIIDDKAKEEEFFRTLGETALAFQKSSRMHSMRPDFIEKAYINNLFHVCEECKVYLLWKYDVILHPSKASPAIDETYKQLIKPKNAGILKYITFKLSDSKKK